MSSKKPIKILAIGRIVLLALMLITPISCVQVDTPPSLELIIVDQYNNPVAQAVVGLFADLEQWGMGENPIQVWKLTDAEGKVVFVDLMEKNYFIKAEKGDENNLKNEISTEVPLLMNKRRQLTIHID